MPCQMQHRFYVEQFYIDVVNLKPALLPAVYDRNSFYEREKEMKRLFAVLCVMSFLGACSS